MKDVLLFRKASLFSTKFLGIVTFIFIIASSGYGQSVKTRVDINRVYDSEVERWLLPSHSPRSQTSLLAAFLVHPVLDPDFSVCLRDSARQFFLELRLLDQNLWRELLTGFMQKGSQTVSLKASVYSTSVSKIFVKKLLQAFDSICPVKENPHLVVQYDGVTFEFRWVKNGGMKKIPISYELKAESYETGLIKLLTQISGDLKNNSFKESNYTDKFK